MCHLLRQWVARRLSAGGLSSHRAEVRGLAFSACMLSLSLAAPASGNAASRTDARSLFACLCKRCQMVLRLHKNIRRGVSIHDATGGDKDTRGFFQKILGFDARTVKVVKVFRTESFLSDCWGLQFQLQSSLRPMMKFRQTCHVGHQAPRCARWPVCGRSSSPYAQAKCRFFFSQDHSSAIARAPILHFQT